MRRRRPWPLEIVRALGLVAVFLVTCLVAGVLASGFLLPAAATAGFLTSSGVDYYNDLPSELEVPPLSERSTILAADGSVITYIYAQNRLVVPLAGVSQNMVNATVSIEDSRFYEHNGVDLRGTVRALVSNASGGVGTQGGSTLTQQYVKNVLLEEAARNQNEEAVVAATASEGIPGYKRKFTEARYALALEDVYTKEEILEKYLNIANFGNAQYGIYAAATYYFQVAPADLTIAQSALLSGIVQRPSELDPVDYPDAALDRRNTVLYRMFELNKISQADYDAAVASPLGITPTETPNGCLNAGEIAFFCDYVIQTIIGADLGDTPSPFAALGATPDERNEALYRGGVTIQTTIDRGLQSIAWQAVRSQIPDTERAGVAMNTIQPGTGRILAMAQNRLYGDANGTYQFTKVNYATGGSLGFQPGSTFKPFTLAAWLKAGKSLSAVVDATDFEGPTKSFPAGCTQLDSRIYTAGNAGDSGGVSGQVPVLRASFNSINGAYLRMSQQLDLCGIAETAASLGVTDMSGREDGVGKPGGYNIVPAMVLGSANVSPLAIAGAYAAFAAEGLFCPPIAVDGIVNRQGEAIPITPVGCTQALDPEVARGVNYALQQTLIQGTARSLGGIGRPAAGKTGTTDQSNATWFAGYTPNLASAVWVGDTDLANLPLSKFPINGRTTRSVFGSTFALPTWGNFMNQAPQYLGLEPVGFANPNDDVLYGPPVRVPSVVGLSVESAQRRLAEAGLGASVSEERRAGPANLVVGQSPGPGGQTRGGSAITLYLGGGGGGGNGRNGGNGANNTGGNNAGGTAAPAVGGPVLNAILDGRGRGVVVPPADPGDTD